MASEPMVVGTPACSSIRRNNLPAPSTPSPVASTATMPDVSAGTGTATTTAAPTSIKAPEIVQASGAHIDASAFLNALVESGCQVENAEYKEVKRGGAIKVVCSKPVDSLNVEIDDL